MKKGKETIIGLPKHWKVRIVIRGAGIVYCLSRTEPTIELHDGAIQNVKMDCFTGTEHGDTIGFLDWSEVSAITWRISEDE